MPPKHLPPSSSATTANLLRRMDAVELRLDKSKQRPTLEPVANSRPLIFSFPGTAETGIISGRYTNENGDSFIVTRINAEVSGGGTLSVDVKLNGSTLLTVSLGSGATTALFASVFVMSPTDYLQVETTAVAGQEEVTVELQ